MNKSAIQRFATWARTELIEKVKQRAYQYGITEDGYGEQDAVTVGGRALTADEQNQRRELVDKIRSKGYTQVMEEVAYTWFNRFIALRFMEVNGFLPSHIRVFSDSTGAFKPEILNDVLHLDLPGLNREKVAEYIEKNRTEDLYRYLLLTQCNALNESLPLMFERMGGFTELLLPNNILKQDSILGRMVTDIPEEDWTDQVQIIGWLYQYYNTELKNETFALLKKNVKITKERIPSATQLYTPDWIVRYLVENSLGRLWLEGHPNDKLKAEWKYYLDEAEQEADVQTQLEAIRAEYRSMKPQDIKVIDPCMGSGHILVYAFDVLIQIYKTYGISERDAVRSILENNLYGLDIDDRAAQLAYFAVMMKARQYDRRIFSRRIQPHVYAIVESNGLDSNAIDYFTNNDPKLKKDFGTLVDELRDAKEYGSILNISQVDFDALYARVDEVHDDISFHRDEVLNRFLPMIRAAEVLAQKYDVVVTNPPYMGNGNMGDKLSSYIKKKYNNGRNDLFAVFIERCNTFVEKNGFQAMVTQHQWMFLSSYTGVRTAMQSSTLVNMAHLGARAFEEISGEVVQTTTFIYRRCQIKDYISVFRRLVGFQSQQAKENAFLAGENTFFAKCEMLNSLPGSALAYWISDNMIRLFSMDSADNHVTLREGIHTGKNDDFLRMWQEVEYPKFVTTAKDYDDLDAKGTWVPYNKGGSYRKWYGNNDLVIGFNAAYRNRMASLSGHVRPSQSLYFKSGATWSALASGKFGLRYYPDGYLFDSKGQVAVGAKSKEIMGLFNLRPYQKMADMIMPTLDYKCGDVKKLPYCPVRNTDFLDLIDRCIAVSKEEWDSYETSWDFRCHPLLPDEKKPTRIEKQFALWTETASKRFEELFSYENSMNMLFQQEYGLSAEDMGEPDRSDITLRIAEKKKDIRSLISYAVGCMFGRYSLDEPGLVYAGGEWDISKYSTIIPDKDNIIPICDDDYFDDDITGRFVKWVETVYGSDTLEENLKFIADALGGRGTPREVIRSYFLNDFYADHLKIYQKRPIYWLFDSGKKNGFKALIYMHRYRSDLLARMRTDYVHEQQERYRTQLMHLADAIEHASASERVKLTKQQKKFQEQALEIRKYEEKVHHLADRNISIDLDDGVKHNYELFSDVLAKIK